MKCILCKEEKECKDTTSGPVCKDCLKSYDISGDTKPEYYFTNTVEVEFKNEDKTNSTEHVGKKEKSSG